MGLGLTPPAAELWNPFYSHTPEPHPDLYYRNMLENPSTVQLQHRILATTSFFAVLALYAYRRRQVHFNSQMRFAMNAVLAAVAVQVTLGITTLLYLVPIPLASAHQANSLVLLSTCLVLCSRVFVKPNNLNPKIGKILQQAHKNEALQAAKEAARVKLVSTKPPPTKKELKLRAQCEAIRVEGEQRKAVALKLASIKKKADARKKAEDDRLRTLKKLNAKVEAIAKKKREAQLAANAAAKQKEAKK